MFSRSSVRWSRRSSGPVDGSGSIASAKGIAVSEAGAWGYTIGSAIFDGLLPVARLAQVRRVLEDTNSADAGCGPQALPSVSPESFLADRLRDELLEEITGSSCSRGRSCRLRPTRQALFQRISCHGTVRALIEAGSLTHHAAVRAVMSPNVGGCPTDSTGDAELPRDDRAAGVRAGMHVLDAAFEECSKDDSLCNSARAAPSWRSSGSGRPTIDR